MVFVSSLKVNGETTAPGEAFTESDPRAPVDAYAVSKAEAEVGLLALGVATGMEVVVVRPPLAYGPGGRANFSYHGALVDVRGTASSGRDSE